MILGRSTHIGFAIGIAAVYLFLYIPIATLIIFSFNENPFGFEWTQFSLHWYRSLIQSSDVWSALTTSLIVASSAVVMSITMGSLLIFFGSQQYLRYLLLLFYTNLAIPEIVLAVGLLSFFYFFSIPLGITTLIASHTLLGLGYVIPIIYTRYLELDQRLIEASLDLGATPIQTFFLIVLPLLSPAIGGAALLVFIISFDDFLLSFFCAGAATQTLPMYIFSAIRAGSSPEISALSTILLVTSSLLVILFSWLQVKKGEGMIQ